MTYCILKAFQKGDGKYSYKKLYDTDHEPINEPTYGEYIGENIVIDIDNKTSEAKNESIEDIRALRDVFIG